MTESEAFVLDTLARLGPSPLDGLVMHTRLEPSRLRRELGRIVELGFGTREEVDGEPTYSAVPYPAG